MAGKLEQMLAVADGLTTSAISEETNANPNQVRTLLRELETSGRVRRSGQRRGTRWHLITDEDRIATRAAELEELSKRNKPSNRHMSAKAAKAVGRGSA
ncbi:MAG: FaeA/PapI family transcriptional regulator [Solirubrobacteraceae bacterium]